MRRALSIAVLLSIGACSSDVPMGSPAADAAGKQFAAPPAGRAALYVFTTAKSAPMWSLALNQRSLGQMKYSQWARVDVPAGNYDLRCSSIVLRDAQAALPLVLTADSVNFVMASYIPLGDPSCRLQAVAEDFGRREVLAGSRIREVGGASD